MVVQGDLQLLECRCSEGRLLRDGSDLEWFGQGLNTSFLLLNDGVVDT
jgi:hypothetical protein